MPKPTMSQAPGSRRIFHVGDRFRLLLQHPQSSEGEWKAFLRTNLTRAERAREETVALAGSADRERGTFAARSWRDIPLRPSPEGWDIDLPLTEVGYFRAKPYCLTPWGEQVWPEGEDLGITVNPDHLRTGNTIYCAFPRMFGSARMTRSTHHPLLDEQFKVLDAHGYTLIPPSGTLRDLTACVPHIMENLGCRILHLLPIGPVPTTFARMGRFGSPYAQLDLCHIDPALVVFDQKTTAVDQFRELAYAVHLRDGLIFLDIVINHTGWGSKLMEEHPEWFLRESNGHFHSPGAWGVTWGDLVELDHRYPELWKHIAESLLIWCRRGVDGFRCDAGYMVPPAAWQYVIARVRQEFPDTVFLLEGLGGAWELTETLLTEGGMQWAYSELFQNYEPMQVSGYMDHLIRQSDRVGALIHYSETHDNLRLAQKGRRWSLLRNQLCALTSTCGGYGFTAGVEWLADEKLDVHEARGLNWGAEPNVVDELAKLNLLLSDHPCFFDGAKLQRLGPGDSKILALSRTSWDGKDVCLVLINLDPDQAAFLALSAEQWKEMGKPRFDLLGRRPPQPELQADGSVRLQLHGGECFCLAPSLAITGLGGEAYRTARAQAAWAYQQLEQLFPTEGLGPIDWKDLASKVARDPFHFLACLDCMGRSEVQEDLKTALDRALGQDCRRYPRVVRWSSKDLNRRTLLPPGHWLLVEDKGPFAVSLEQVGERRLHARSIPVEGGHVAALRPEDLCGEVRLILDPFREAGQPMVGTLQLLPRTPRLREDFQEGLALLTNGRGAMARLHADLGNIESKYDCLLGANLHPTVPCDRHILAKRLRAWVNADGFITALNKDNLLRFKPGPPAQWVFVANAGDGRTVEIHLWAQFLPLQNTLVVQLERPDESPEHGEDLPESCRVSLILRVDLEDRGFHEETQRNAASEAHFTSHTHVLEGVAGFQFAPSEDRRLKVLLDEGRYHPSPEWSEKLFHAVEGSRGLPDRGDAWSPGWFELDLGRGSSRCLLLSAEAQDPPLFQELADLIPARNPGREWGVRPDPFREILHRACEAFLARREEGLTVIAGYPWFLDWGRDTLIACRGLLAAGLLDEVQRILMTFAHFEDRGTLPNMLAAESTGNRETSDAPLWFALACEEAAGLLGEGFFQSPVGDRSLKEVLLSIGCHYVHGTPTGIRMDPESGLVWSPSHFTWMDTNYPAGTPREGYPIEIQALWIRLLRLLGSMEPEGGWRELERLVLDNLELFWREDEGWYGDCLHAAPGVGASQALVDDHLRSNQIFLVSLGLVEGPRARRSVFATMNQLLVPGGLRSLAPLPVRIPLSIQRNGQFLNDPTHPYWGRYQGDEDTCRKPAYHNGTAWVWTFPSFCESIPLAWPDQGTARDAALAYLGSLQPLLETGCLGQLPEILDGDAPHTPRGCDAQAWSVTEALRVWHKLQGR